MPAIEAWQAHHTEVFGKPTIEVPMELWGEHFPNVAQARFLIEAGVPEPLVATLTRIGTVEGYGANIRLLKPSNLQRFFDEDIVGTAIDHLGRRTVRGPRARRGGLGGGGWPQGHVVRRPRRRVRDEGRRTRHRGDARPDGFRPRGRDGVDVERLLPSGIDPQLEAMASLMIRVLFIEVSAFHTFKWAEAWLSDPDLVAGDGVAGRLVAYIRADETPHVAYLATALTEIRDRTWVGEDGTATTAPR